MRKIIVGLALLLASSGGFGQIFEDIAPDQGINVYVLESDYGNGVSVVDYDNDGWDDITLCLNGQDIRRFKNTNGVFQEDSPIPNIYDAKHLTYVDIDNDFDLDVFILAKDGPLKILENQSGLLVDVTATSGFIQDSLALSFGAAWGDYDKDGDLDVFICNYTWNAGSNWLYRNDGNFTFTDVTSITGIGLENHLSFQPTWIDYDHDSWPDLYIIEDKDPPNLLYRNLGNGSFEEVGSLVGADIIRDAMTNTIGDYNHDGLLDIYITDGDNNVLLEQQEDFSFQDKATDLGLEVNTFCWGAQWLDYNNDTHKDLHVLTNTPLYNNQNYFYVQDDQGGFTQYSQAFLFDNHGEAYCNAICDFDNNGFVDIVVGATEDDAAKFWLNSGNENNFLKVFLEGTISNSFGIGSWIHCYFEDHHEVEYTLCGEAYLSQNSYTKIFGLAQSEMVDSLIIEWPSGHVDQFFDIPANSSLHLIEGSSLNLSWPQDTVYLCDGDSLYYQFDGFDNYDWSHGPASQGAFINEPGAYTVTASTELGIQAFSDTLVVLNAPNTEYEWEALDPSCSGSSDGEIWIIEDQSPGFTAVWTLESDTVLPTNLIAGTYLGYVTDSIGCTSELVVELIEPDPITWTSTLQDVTCFGDSSGSIEIEFSGGTPPFTVNLPNEGLNLPSGNFWWYVQDANACSDSAMFTIDTNPEIFIEIEVDPDLPGNDSATVTILPSGGTPPFEILWENAQDQFEIVLPSGFHSFTVTDSLGCTYEGFVDIPTSIQDLSQSDFLLFPNPANEFLYIQHEKQSELLVSIHDLAGRKVQEIQTDQNCLPCPIDIRSLQPGMYLITISAEDLFFSFSSVVVIQLQP